jgi:asparaginyl-tRNA synthetase
MLHYVLDSCLEDLEFFNKWVDDGLLARLEAIAESEFRRITYSEAVAALEKTDAAFEFPVEWGSDLQSEHERHLTEVIFGQPVVVTDYPKDIKAFYMRRNDDGRTVAAMDVLVPGVGEIVGGSQREERHDVLLESIKEKGLPLEEYWWYLDLRRFGTVPHAGFGLGFGRIVQFATGMQNIRDIIPFPRTPNSAEF